MSGSEPHLFKLEILRDYDAIFPAIQIPSPRGRLARPPRTNFVDFVSNLWEFQVIYSEQFCQGLWVQ